MSEEFKYFKFLVCTYGECKMQKTVLITGSSRGIGKAAAELFAAEGYQVVIHYHHSEKEAISLCEKIKKRGQCAILQRGDVADRKQVGEVVNNVLSEFGSIDVLVNNAGIAQQKLFSDITDLDWDQMMNVNVKGAFHFCQCVLPLMIHRKKGKIINISSVWGLTGASCEVHYSASKAAVIGFTKALAKELAPSNIQINCIAPGVIDTEMNAALSEEAKRFLSEEIPLQRFGTPEEVAQSILFLASENSEYITGQVISPNGGFFI